MISQQNPVKLFVSHAWQADDDYLRVFEFLEGARNFFYMNYSAPDRRPAGADEAQREELRRQIAPVECALVLAAHHRVAPALVEFQATFAKSADKPVIVLGAFGENIVIARQLRALADEVVEWDERAIVDAIRRQARHEETTRWDTIEFKLD